VSDGEYNLNKQFQEIALQVADELDLDEIEAAKLAIDAEPYEKELGRPKRECAIIRFHQQRQYLLDCIRLLLDLAREEDELLLEDAGQDLGFVGQYVDHNILRAPSGAAPEPASKTRFVPACVASMHDIRASLQRLSDQLAGASVLGRAGDMHFQETAEFIRISLVQQHELLSVLLCAAIERHKAVESDFVEFLRAFKQTERYDFTVGELPTSPTFDLPVDSLT
jgi:nuclear pore complex protein Nup205